MYLSVLAVRIWISGIHRVGSATSYLQSGYYVLFSNILPIDPTLLIPHSSIIQNIYQPTISFFFRFEALFVYQLIGRASRVLVAYTSSSWWAVAISWKKNQPTIYVFHTMIDCGEVQSCTRKPNIGNTRTSLVYIILNANIRTIYISILTLNDPYISVQSGIQLFSIVFDAWTSDDTVVFEANGEKYGPIAWHGRTKRRLDQRIYISPSDREIDGQSSDGPGDRFDGAPAAAMSRCQRITCCIISYDTSSMQRNTWTEIMCSWDYRNPLIASRGDTSVCSIREETRTARDRCASPKYSMYRNSFQIRQTITESLCSGELARGQVIFYKRIFLRMIQPVQPQKSERGTRKQT